MKKIIPLLLLAFLVFACHKDNSVVVSGTIINTTDTFARICINYFDSNDTVSIKTDGTFIVEIPLEEEHLAGFYYQKNMFPLYLEPGGNIVIEFDSKNNQNRNNTNVSFSGEKSETTALLNSIDGKWRQYNWQEIIKMPVDSFLLFARNVQKEVYDELEILKSEHTPSDKFIQRAKLRYDVMLVSGIEYYKMVAAGSTTIPKGSFTEFTNIIPENDKELCKEVKEYCSYLIPRFKRKISNTMKASGLHKETTAYINKMADEIIALNVPQQIKDEVGRYNFSVFYKRPDSLRQVYRARYPDVVKNQVYLDEFMMIADARDRIEIGKLAPSFNYPDINGRLVSLESFRGKVVYVDVWATWCSPCKGEIPHLKKLEEELNNEDIVFVSVSIDREKDKEAWKNMVKEKELGGYQLYASGDWESKIAKDYVIRGIPYFIIIDKEGELVEVNASRPSNPKTKEKLLKLARS